MSAAYTAGAADCTTCVRTPIDSEPLHRGPLHDLALHQFSFQAKPQRRRVDDLFPSRKVCVFAGWLLGVFTVWGGPMWAHLLGLPR